MITCMSISYANDGCLRSCSCRPGRKTLESLYGGLLRRVNPWRGRIVPGYRRREIYEQAFTVAEPSFILGDWDRVLQMIGESGMSAEIGGWRLLVSHFRLEFSQPAVGAPENLRGAALVSTVLGDGATRDGPFEIVQEPGERSSRL